MAREHNATSFMVMQAALAVLLSKLSASSDVAVGFPIAGRRDPALDELVGFFVNTLVLRVDLAGDPTVAELLAQVRQRSLAAYEHQDVPFEVLVERLNPTRSLTHHPLVQVMLAWQNLPAATTTPPPGWRLGDLQVTPMPVDTHTARMDLTFSLAERFTEAGEPAGIGGAVEFRTDVFDAASIEALIERLQRVLVAMTADPTRRLSSIDLLDAAEHARLERSGNRAVLTAPAPPAVSIPALFAAQVDPYPGGGGGDVPRAVRGRTASWRRPPIGWRTCWPLAGRARANVWRCCWSARPRRSWRCWRCSRPGRPICRSTRRHPDARIEFVLADAAPIAALTTAALADRLAGRTSLWSSISTTPPSAPNPTPRCRRRHRTISRT